MGRENKKEAVAALHREIILNAAENLFTDKGYAETTIDDISKASRYSRRTLYAYYESKDDILCHITAKGLSALKAYIVKALETASDFETRYRGICAALTNYYRTCPHSRENVIKARPERYKLWEAGNSSDGSQESFPDTPSVFSEIFALGSEINRLMTVFIEQGQDEGVVKPDILVLPTVYILWSSISSLLELAETKGDFLFRSLSMSEEDFLEYGFRQIISSILAGSAKEQWDNGR